MSGRLLVCDADPGEYDRLFRGLQDAGFESVFRPRAEDAMQAADAGESDLLLIGGRVAGAIDLCRRVSAEAPEVPVIVFGADRDYDLVLAALRAGAYDYQAVPLSIEALEPVLRRALALRSHGHVMPSTALGEAGFEDLVGVSSPMRRLYELLEQAAQTNASVLITGESGTGKELVARALHRRSLRRDGPFVAINCSALPEPLLESELFGHVKGAFTDAKVARSGLFVKASGGTILLDEIAEMPLSLQPKLLRALQERTLRPVGGDHEVPFDVRVIAATNRNLEAAVAEKQFREDLFYRINVIHVDVPPLRDRASDVLLLAQHFVQHFALLGEKTVVGLSAPAAEKVLAYPWPGNVRELQNCMERAVALTRQQEVSVADLPEKVRRFRRSHVLVVSNDPSELVSMDEVERRYLVRVLQAVNGNKKEAARILGFDRKTLYRKLSRYAIEVDRAAVAPRSAVKHDG